MTKISPKRIALKTLKKHKCFSLNNYTDLKRIIELNQFTIIEYKKHTNSQPVSELIKRLGLENEIEKNNSFLYIKNNIKFVFINTDVSDEEKCALLRHELGHICDPEFKSRKVSYSEIQKEEFANEFSLYTKSPPISFVIYVFLAKRWKLVVSLVALTACVLACLFLVNTLTNSPSKSVSGDASNSAGSDTTYYVTSSGEKYHKKHCIIIKYKNNLTKIKLNSALNEGYKSCLICNPEE